MDDDVIATLFTEGSFHADFSMLIVSFATSGMYGSGRVDKGRIVATCTIPETPRDFLMSAVLPDVDVWFTNLSPTRPSHPPWLDQMPQPVRIFQARTPPQKHFASSGNFLHF